MLIVCNGMSKPPHVEEFITKFNEGKGGIVVFNAIANLGKGLVRVQGHFRGLAVAAAPSVIAIVILLRIEKIVFQKGSNKIEHDG
jgi:hypothetical protein